MLNNLDDIMTEVLVRLDEGTTAASSGGITDTILKSWFNQAYAWASSYKKWPFTERRDNTQTYASGTEDYAYPDNFRSDSIRFLQVGSDRLRKVNFADYQIYKEDFSSGEDKIFTDLGRRYYINNNAQISGTITAWGQFTPVPVDTTDLTITTVFSDAEEEGNEAIVERMVGYAKIRAQKSKETREHFATAKDLLDGVWERHKDEQFAYHTHERGMFKRIDVLGGAMREDTLKRDQWY
jgi:hypothetical protein